MKTNCQVSTYLKVLEQNGVKPNFYCSEPYLILSDVNCYTEDGWIWIEDKEWTLFPPMPINQTVFCKIDFKPIWADFYFPESQNFIFPDLYTKFFDLEFIFDPFEFRHMNGGLWETFRKNSRKWPKRNPEWVYCDWYDTSQAIPLLCDWLERKSNNAEDAELIAKFFTENIPGINRRCLYDKNERLKAVNVWDENYKYINYRLCIVDKNELFLDEFSRWLFYTDSQIYNSGKLVNDGGCLGNKGLEDFKRKMNPIRVRNVYSWVK